MRHQTRDMEQGGSRHTVPVSHPVTLVPPGAGQAGFAGGRAMRSRRDTGIT